MDFVTLEHMRLHRKSHLKMSKKSEQKFSVYISTFYKDMPSFTEKMTFFVTCIQKKKNILWKAHFSSEFCLFYTRHKKYRFFTVTTLWAHRTSRRLHDIVRIFWHSKILFKYILKTESMCSRPSAACFNGKKFKNWPTLVEYINVLDYPTSCL